ncbi:hypothetical protein [Paraburkholderia megapolitana]|uniref:hypothetical protein n=1 Tax=Paraburkholderia megapolitana TaxID=420953 RepID=UPI0038B7EA2A
MNKVTFEQCVEGAWRDAANFIGRYPLFVVALSAGLFFIGVARNELRGSHSFSVFLALGALWLLRLLLITVSAVQTLRHVLLRHETAIARASACWSYLKYGGLVYGFAACTMALMAMIVILMIVAFHMLGIRVHELASGAVVICIVVMFAIWVHVRLSLLPIHVAIGMPLHWRAAWRDSRGHCLGILGTYLAISLTLAFVALIVGVIAGAVAGIFPGALAENRGLLTKSIQDLLSIPAVVVVSAGSAWIYRRYAAELLTQSGAG